MDNLYAVIFAGGVGSRLWPVSRVSSPKQIKPFIGTEETLIQKTFNRIRRLLPIENIYVSTTKNYADLIKQQLPELKPGNLIIEPQLRSTCPAIGLATAVIAKRHPGADVMNVWADHYYGREDAYIKIVQKSYRALKQNPDSVMSVGLKIEYPSSAYGYLEVEDEPARKSGVMRVKRFIEKPDLDRAAQFMKAGNYYWNPALFMWQADHMLDLYRRFVPNIYQGLMEIRAAWDTPRANKVLNKVYPTFTKVSVEYAILEKGLKMLLLPAVLSWRDIGSWQAVYDVMSGNGQTDTAAKGKVITIDSQDVLVFNEDEDKLVAAVGLTDVAIVNTQDAVLVIKKSKDQDVKKLIKKIESKKMTQYL